MRFRRRAETEAPLLEGTESDLIGFGDSARDAFEDAWSSSDVSDDAEQRLTTSIPDRDVGSSDADAVSKELGRRLRPQWVVVGLIVLVLAGAAVFVIQNRDDAVEPASETPIAALDIVARSTREPRTYATGPQAAALAVGAVDERYAIDASGTLARTGALDAPVPFALMQWGQRLHVVVPIDVDEACVAATIVTSDLRPIDLAQHGTSCPDDLSVTGDRVACLGEDLVALELWPIPDRGPERPVVEPAELRVRIDRPGGAVSERGVLDVSDLSASHLTEMTGLPGDTVDGGRAGVAGACELIDRADVVVVFL